MDGDAVLLLSKHSFWYTKAPLTLPIRPFHQLLNLIWPISTDLFVVILWHTYTCEIPWAWVTHAPDVIKDMVQMLHPSAWILKGHDTLRVHHQTHICLASWVLANQSVSALDWGIPPGLRYIPKTVPWRSRSFRPHPKLSAICRMSTLHDRPMVLFIHFLVDLTICSNIPPHQGALSRFPFHVRFCKVSVDFWIIQDFFSISCSRLECLAIVRSDLPGLHRRILSHYKGCKWAKGSNKVAPWDRNWTCLSQTQQKQLPLLQ